MIEVLECSEAQKTEIFKLHNTTQEECQRLVERIKEWMKSQPHFPELIDDAALEKFILYNKLNLEKVKSKLTTYYITKTTVPEFFCQNPNSPEMIQVMDVCYLVPLPKLTSDYDRITIFKIIEEDVNKFDPVMFTAFSLNLAEIRLREDYRHKEIHIYDCIGTKFGHVSKYSPMLLKKISDIYKKLFDNNVMALHFINIPSFMDSFLSFTRGFMSNKVEQRMIIHKDMQSLHDAVGKEHLPEEYGGSAGSLADLQELWRKKFLESDAFFEHLRSIKVNMDLLPDNLKIDDQFGAHGNFRKLDVD